MSLHFGTTDISRIDAGAYFVLAELKAVNYAAGAGQTIVGNLGRDAHGHWVRVGADGTPIARTSATVTREVVADARRQARQMPKGTPKGKGKGKKPANPKLTAAEKQSARDATHAANRDKVMAQLHVDGDVQASLLKLANGGQPDGDVGGVVDAGLAVRDSQGQYRLTPQGRALLAAANAGDAGRARDALSLGKDRVAAAGVRAQHAQTAKEKAAQKEQERAQRQKELAQRDAQRAKQQAARAGSSSSGSSASPPPKPTTAEKQQQHRADVASAMQAANAGLNQSAFDALTSFADGAVPDSGDMLQALADETGLIEVGSAGDFRLSKAGRAFIGAANTGNTRGALDALSRSVDSLAAQNTATETPMPPATPVKMLGIDPNAHPGAMIAFLLDDTTIAALQDACEGLAVTPDHLTLIYLVPNASDLDAQKNRLIAQLVDIASGFAPVTGTINGYGRFAGDEEEGFPLYANFDAPDLPDFYDALEDAVECCECDTRERNHGFTPHITLTYLEPDAPTPQLQLPQLQITFDRFALVWGGETITFPLLGTGDDAGEAGEMDGVGQLMQALGASTEGLAPDDTLIYGGDVVKSYSNGHIGGYLVRFGSPEQTDLAGDYFTPASDFGIVHGAKTAIYFNHRMPFKTRDGRSLQIKEQIGEGTLSVDRTGVFIDAVLYNREQYKQVLDSLGWSSGTAAHLVDRVAVSGKAAFLKKWPLGLDASLTPGPCEPRAAAIPLKAYTSQETLLEIGPEALKSAVTSGSVTGGAPYIIHSKETTPVDQGLATELKAMFDEAFKGLAPTIGNIESKMQTLSDSVDARLKAFEDSPALKSSGFVSQDGGSADKNVKSFADWLIAVQRGDKKRLTTVYKSAYTDFGGDGLAIKDMGENSGGTGGYLVPTEYEPLLAKIDAEAAIVEPRARPVRMGAAIRKVPMLKQTANPGSGAGNSAFFGGMTFTWEPENTDVSADKSDPSFEMIEFIARKLTGLTVSSNELTEDAPTLEAELTQLFGEGLAHAKDYFYLRGSGVGQPLGILNAPATYALTRAASGNNVDIADVAGLMARMIPGGIAGAVWISHPLNIADLIQMVLGQQPVFQPDAHGPVVGTLLGRPLMFSEYLPAPGSAGDFGLYSLPFYGCGIRRGVAIAMSEHARFDKDQITWRITYRGDGKPLLDSTLKLADGSNTVVSPFVKLS